MIIGSTRNFSLPAPGDALAAAAGAAVGVAEEKQR